VLLLVLLLAQMNQRPVRLLAVAVSVLNCQMLQLLLLFLLQQY
jgi:hypothetical protein